MDNGLTWIQIPGADDLTGNGYDWSVPKPWGNKKKCLVRVIGYDASEVKVGSDRSDAPFTIEVVKLTSPNGGRPPLKSGTEHPITWATNRTKNPVAKIKLYYTINGGTTWNLIKTLKGNPGSHPWLVVTVKKPRTDCKIKVELNDVSENILGTDASDGYFTIQP